MPKHIPALATRAAFVATTTAAAALVALLPATTSATASAAPAPAPVSAPASVTLPVTPVHMAAPLRIAAPAGRTAAVSAALTKVGSPYRWGATGPSAFDCSGLIQWSFKQAGISVPRTSREQSRFGTPVSKADLQPGDLVFFYTPVSHAGIYIGDGKIVHASNRKSPVKVSDMSRMKFNSARRI